jgi:hypothetical protein
MKQTGVYEPLSGIGHMKVWPSAIRPHTGAMRFLGEAPKGFRLIGAVAFGLEGLGLRCWHGCLRHRALGLSEV